MGVRPAQLPRERVCCLRVFIGTRFSNGRGDEGDDSTNHNETTTGLFSEQTMFRIPSTNYELAT